MTGKHLVAAMTHLFPSQGTFMEDFVTKYLGEVQKWIEK
jgi:hypothetical protein